MKNRCFVPSDILLPKNSELKKWSVIACDQYTSEPEYWNRVDAIVGDAASTLKLTLPEIYLNSDDVAQRIDAIHAEMKKYLNEGILTEYKNSYIYIEREVSNGCVRHGLVGAVDLEAYNFEKGSKSPIRATEGTILSRIPPRLRVRESAPLELPHVMILIDDPKKTVIEPLAEKKSELESVYDFDLMLSSGHISGYRVTGDDAEAVSASLDGLYDAPDGLVFAVGDGNHSLATAKQ